MSASIYPPRGDCVATDYIPAWAVTCWVDDSFVYALVPAKSGPPLIQKYPLTEGGLIKALNILRVQRRTIAKGKVHRESTPVIKHIRPRELSANARETALAILRRRGIL